jgi:hypothetical protein
VRVLLAVAPFLLLAPFLGFPLWQRHRWSALHPGEPPSPGNYASRVVPFALLCVLLAVGLYFLGNPVMAVGSAVTAVLFCWLAFHYRRRYYERHTSGP